LVVLTPTGMWAPDQIAKKLNNQPDRAGSEAWAVFFGRDAVPREEALNVAETEGQALLRKSEAHLLNRGVLGRAQRRQRGIMVGFDAARAAVTAQNLGTRFAIFKFSLPPVADDRWADPKALTSFAISCTSIHGGQNTDPEIEREGFRHAYLPTSTLAVSLNKSAADWGTSKEAKIYPVRIPLWSSALWSTSFSGELGKVFLPSLKSSRLLASGTLPIHREPAQSASHKTKRSCAYILRNLEAFLLTDFFHFYVICFNLSGNHRAIRVHVLRLNCRHRLWCVTCAASH
jgi:hypothetical protein